MSDAIERVAQIFANRAAKFGANRDQTDWRWWVSDANEVIAALLEKGDARSITHRVYYLPKVAVISGVQ